MLTLHPSITNPVSVKRFTTLEQDLLNKHEHIYTYEGFYYNTKTKIKIICRTHGEFEQKPNDHLNGQGCPSCGKVVCAVNTRKEHEHFLKKARKVHGDTYTYNEKYIDNNTKILITCSLHGDFPQRPKCHVLGQGCPKCANVIRGEKTQYKYFNKPTTLYYVKMEKEGKVPLYKIGITIHSVMERFRKEISAGLKITILSEELFSLGREAWYKEQLILGSFQEYQYKGDDIINGGNSELFVTDVLYHSSSLI